MSHPIGYRSLFWPIALIGLGVVWLLSNLGFITPLSWYSVLQLWPLLLIAIGLDLIFGRRSPLIGSLIGVVTLVVVLIILATGPALGLRTNVEVRSSHFTEPAGAATSAQMNFSLSPANTFIGALNDSTALIDARLKHVGDIDFSVQGDAQKVVRLQPRNDVSSFYWPIFGNEQLRWDIGLNPKVPLDLRVNASSGSATLSLRDLNIKSLKVNVSSGNLSANMPAMPERYDMHADVSSGSLDFNVPDNANLNASVQMSSGSVTFDVSDQAGVQVNVQESSAGSVNVPRNYTRTVDNGRDQGTWESPNYGAAPRKIVITITHISSGSLQVR
jgi:hypothetical protein